MSETSDAKTPVIDVAILDELRLLVEDPAEAQLFLADLIGTFASSAHETLGELREAADRADRRRVARLAHRLKGISKNIGAERVARICRDLELEAETIPVATLTDATASLATEIAAAEAALRGSTNPS